MPFSEQEFLEQSPLAEYRETIGAFIRDLQASGYLVKRTANGASIRKPMPGRVPPLTVGWIAPPGVRMRPGSRDVTLGTWMRPKGDDVRRSMANDLEKQLSALTSRLGPYCTMAKDAAGVHLTPQLFMERRQDIINLLRHLAEMIDPPGESMPIQ